MSTGLVTTTRVTHATPSVLYAHASDRYWESDGDVLTKAKDDPSHCKDIGRFNIFSTARNSCTRTLK